MNDTELIEGCKAGKREALETIYRLFSRQMAKCMECAIAM